MGQVGISAQFTDSVVSGLPDFNPFGCWSVRFAEQEGKEMIDHFVCSLYCEHLHSPAESRREKEACDISGAEWFYSQPAN